MSKKLTAFALLFLLATIGFVGCAKKCECLYPTPAQASSVAAAEPAESRSAGVSPDLARKRYIK